MVFEHFQEGKGVVAAQQALFARTYFLDNTQSIVALSFSGHDTDHHIPAIIVAGCDNIGIGWVHIMQTLVAV